ncbi:MAG: response regulator transcription factor [Pirellulales bacterium]
MALKIVIADDHEVVRSGLKSLLADSEIEVVGEAASAPEAVRVALALRPDVAILDVRMGETDGLSALAQLRQERPEMAVIILSTYDNPTYIARALALGASGYLLKGVGREELLDALRKAASGDNA